MAILRQTKNSNGPKCIDYIYFTVFILKMTSQPLNDLKFGVSDLKNIILHGIYILKNVIVIYSKVGKCDRNCVDAT